ncbi:SPOR domain-containing protein [Rhodanobacter sp. L36]|uniref:SPOR domain-containing protein n=1 Tax=Rhodanobacter sp. L36 TaxID=1747221 RepID=UPI00131D06CE|nr:SPOR domain-containing protein [Rhodanobacter sp. L36]
MKTRLLGAAVLIALAVVFVPMFFSGKPPAPGGDQSVSLVIPPAPDGDLQTKTMSLAPDATVTSPAVATSTTTAVIPGAAGRLATVDIGSNRPRDVETDPNAGKPPQPTTVTTATGTTLAQPVIPMQNTLAASTPVIKPKPRPTSVAPVASKPVSAPVSAAETPAPAAHGNYSLNLSAYASAAGAANLERRVHALGYPVSSRAINQAGQSRTLVMAGPFATRTAAEAARLKITQSIPGAPARLEQDASHDDDAAAAPSARNTTAATKRAGGWAVQLAAMSSQGDATALRDKLRANGFDGFVDSVQSGGKKLWRVRAGPQTQRGDALRVHDQIKSKLGIDGNVVSMP